MINLSNLIYCFFFVENLNLNYKKKDKKIVFFILYF